MENVFTQNITVDELVSIGVPENTESDYLARISSEDDNNISILFDLSQLFSLRNNAEELKRIDKQLEAAGAFANGFNE